MTLKQYQKKRDFKKTPEPKGEALHPMRCREKVAKKTKKPPALNRTRSGSGIFVVHEHWARSHHFDFRIEIDGVLKSWAVPKGPPQKVNDKRLAIQVEDHPLEYHSFEGQISEGQYGAGKVKIYDKGKIKYKNVAKNLIEFELFGKKLKGRYTLLQPQKFEKKNWLLIKNK